MGRDVLHVTGVGLAIVVGSCLSGWWLVGDQSEDGLATLDYMIRAPDLPGPLVVAIGLVATVAVGLLLRSVWPVSAARRPAAVLVAVGVILGWTGRVITAGVGGANIGGGILLLFVMPIVALVAAAALGFFIRAHQRAA